MGLPAVRPQWRRLDIQGRNGGCHSFSRRIISFDADFPVLLQVFDLLDKTREDTEDLLELMVKQKVELVWQVIVGNHCHN